MLEIRWEGFRLIKLSDLLAPMGKTPSKLKDRGMIEMVKAGFAMWNPNAKVIMRLPMGEDMDRRIENYLVESLKQLSPQRVFCPVPEGAMAVAVRQMKKAAQLPMLFVQRRGEVLEFQGYCTDRIEGTSMALSALRGLGVALTEAGLSVRRWDETVRQGVRSRLIADGEAGDLDLLEGLGCSCGWRGPSSCPMEFGGSVDDRESDMDRVHTPGIGTIESLCDFLSVSPDKTVKTMCFSDEEGRGVIALVRGDRTVSRDKLSSVTGADLHPSSDDELKDILGDLVGFLGPIGLPKDVTVWADSSVENIPWAVIGANEKDYHITGARWGRDFSAPVADIAAMEVGDMCPLCGEPLSEAFVIPLAALELWNQTADSEPSLTYVNEERRKIRPFCWIIRVHMTSLEGFLFRLPSIPAVFSPADVLIRSEKPEDHGLAVSAAMELESFDLTVLLDDVGGIGAKGSIPLPWEIAIRKGEVEIRRPDGICEIKTCSEAVDTVLKEALQGRSRI